MPNVVETNPNFKEEMTIREMLEIGIELMVSLDTGMKDREVKELVFVLRIGDIGYGLYALDHDKAILFCDTIIESESIGDNSLGEVVYNIVSHVHSCPRNIRVFSSTPENCLFYGHDLY